MTIRQKKLLVSKTIQGKLPSMKNQRRLVRNKKTGKPMSIKSREALDYQEYFLLQIRPSEKIGYDGMVSLRCRVWYPSARNDLDIEFFKDLLQTSGIIKNDRQIYHHEAFKGLDRDNPRVVFSLYEAEGAI